MAVAAAISYLTFSPFPSPVSSGFGRFNELLFTTTLVGFLLKSGGATREQVRLGLRSHSQIHTSFRSLKLDTFNKKRVTIHSIKEISLMSFEIILVLILLDFLFFHFLQL